MAPPFCFPAPLGGEGEFCLFGHFGCILDKFLQSVFGQGVYEHSLDGRQRGGYYIGPQQGASGDVLYMADGGGQDAGFDGIIVEYLADLPDEFQPSESMSSSRPRNGET